MTARNPRPRSGTTGLLAQARHSERFHRALPWSAAAPLVRAWALRVWARDATVREHARMHQRFLLGSMTDDAGIDDVAREYVVQHFYKVARWFRPELTTRIPPAGLQRLTNARSGGRGVLLNFMHYGDIHGPLGAISRAGVPVHTMVDAKFFAPAHTAIERQILRTLTYQGGTALAAQGSRSLVQALLAGGAVVAVASDVPGSFAATMLGRPIALSSGSIRIAAEVGALVLPIVLDAAGPRPAYYLGEAVDAAAVGIQGALLRILAEHERAVSAFPATVEKPLRRWAARGPDAALFARQSQLDLVI